MSDPCHSERSEESLLSLSRGQAARSGRQGFLAALGMTMVLVAASTALSQQPPCDVFCHSRLAREAEAARDHAQFETHVRAVVALAPSHPGVVYQMARAFSLRGAPDSAVAWL